MERPCTILREKMEKANIEEQRLEAVRAASEQLTLIIFKSTNSTRVIIAGSDKKERIARSVTSQRVNQRSRVKEVVSKL